MTGEYGASTQLEKIDMLDFADMVVINKFDKMGSEGAFDDVLHAMPIPEISMSPTPTR